MFLGLIEAERVREWYYETLRVQLEGNLFIFVLSEVAASLRERCQSDAEQNARGILMLLQNSTRHNLILEHSKREPRVDTQVKSEFLGCISEI